MPLVQRLRWLPYLIVYYLACLTRRVHQDKVVFIEGTGTALNGNLAWIREALPVAYQVDEFFPARPSPPLAKAADRYRLVLALAQAGVIFMDDYLQLVHALRIRRGVRLVQVWHAMGAMKKMGFSRVGRVSNAPPPTSLLHRNYTDVIVSSEAMRQIYAQAFKVSINKVAALGTPRSDFFFDMDAQQAVRQNLYASYPMLSGRRVIVFAPTYRDLGKGLLGYPPQFLDLDRIGRHLGANDILVLKFHPFCNDHWRVPPGLADKIVDLSGYPEFNHLLVVADLLVTDYSSAIFDYALLKKPVLFYSPDMDAYDQTRGFYYPFDTYTYGPVVIDMDGLIDGLSSTALDQNRWASFTDLFLGSCDGQSTPRLIQAIMGVGHGRD